jgi:D-alanyl-D-alanine carboxypeptidase
MKGWLVALALLIVLAATGAGLWVTWDSTSTSSDRLPAAAGETVLPPTTRRDRTKTTVPPPPPCATAPEPVTSDPATDWATTLVDTGRHLPADFAPDDLVEVTEAGFDSHDRVREFVLPDLAALREGAAANGTPIVVISAYRSFAYQHELFAERSTQVGEQSAVLETARPGHSEHQLGTAIDVLGEGGAELTSAFGSTPAGRWVADNAPRYGFVVSYPEDARDRTCYEYEPWHLRYVGRDVAAQIRGSGLTPREWMAARAGDSG